MRESATTKNNSASCTYESTDVVFFVHDADALLDQDVLGGTEIGSALGASWGREEEALVPGASTSNSISSGIVAEDDVAPNSLTAGNPSPPFAMACWPCAQANVGPGVSLDFDLREREEALGRAGGSNNSLSSGSPT